jgi:hypothetical protein
MHSTPTLTCNAIQAGEKPELGGKNPANAKARTKSGLLRKA